MFSIRKARRSDIPAVEEMLLLLFPKARPRFLDGDSYLVAERDGVPVGFCHFRMREKNCYVVGIGVLPQYREHGVGSRLLAEVLSRADRAGLPSTTLKVRAFNSATKLYLRMGFFERRWGDTLVLVRKKPS